MTADTRIPPEYEGQTWPYRITEYTDGQPVERMVQSPFPPMTVGVPGELVMAFLDFQRHDGIRQHREHPEWFCADCGWRYVAPICTYDRCKSSRTEPTKAPRTADGTPYRCLTCKRPFLALLVCGPCLDVSGRALAVPPKTSPPVRRPATASGARR